MLEKKLEHGTCLILWSKQSRRNLEFRVFMQRVLRDQENYVSYVENKCDLSGKAHQTQQTLTALYGERGIICNWTCRSKKYMLPNYQVSIKFCD